MPSLSVEEIQQYSKYKADIFIETGTYLGDTTNNALKYFDNVYTIELSPYYAQMARDRFKNNLNLSIIEGDSSKVLYNLCNIITKSVFFWLDGHWSGGNTARGSIDCPLLEEIKIINNNLKSKCIIAIDDVRLFNTNINENWSGITRDNILEIVKSRLESCTYYPSQYNPEDRMVLHLNEI